jgi:hypothetical protein
MAGRYPGRTRRASSVHDHGAGQQVEQHDVAIHRVLRRPHEERHRDEDAVNRHAALTPRGGRGIARPAMRNAKPRGAGDDREPPCHGEARVAVTALSVTKCSPGPTR